MDRDGMSKSVLVIAAHPDDEVLGCGATISKHVSAGDRVWHLILGEGVMSRQGVSQMKKDSALEQLWHSAEEAAKLLGVERVVLKKFPCCQFDTLPLLDIVHAVEETIQALQPSVIYTHHFGDVNIDHRLTAEAVETAIRPNGGSFIEEVLSFEVPSSTEWNFAKTEVFRPNVFVELSEQNFAAKMKALLGPYRQEMRTYPHSRSEQYVRALAICRGGQAGFSLAESFVQMLRRKREA